MAYAGRSAIRCLRTPSSQPPMPAHDATTVSFAPRSAWVAAALLWTACSSASTSTAPAVERSTTTRESPAGGVTEEPAESAAEVPTPEAPAPAEHAWPPFEPSRLSVGGGCTIGDPVSLTADPGSVAAAGTPDGALVAYASGEQVTLQSTSAAGVVVAGPSNVAVPRLQRVLGLARFGEGLLLVTAASCSARDWRHVCLVAVPLDASGAPAGETVTRSLPRATLEDLPDWVGVSEATPYVLSSPGATSAWVVSSFDTSHAGDGVRLVRIHRDDDGAPSIGEPQSFVDALPDGAFLTGFRVAAGDDDALVFFASRLEGEASARYLGRLSTSQTTSRTTEITGDLGRVVHDLVLDSGRARVLFDRGEAYLVATIDESGAVVDAQPVDRTRPLPPPFTDRVLVEHAGRSDHPTRVLHDATGRRLGEPIPRGSLAWTSPSTALVAGSTEDGTRLWPLTCTSPH